jgi:hypothetical protein
MRERNGLAKILLACSDYFNDYLNLFVCNFTLQRNTNYTTLVLSKAAGIVIF